MGARQTRRGGPMGQQVPDAPAQGMKWFKSVIYAQLS